jgi:cytochrome c
MKTFVSLAIAMVLAGCDGATDTGKYDVAATGGDPARGKVLIRSYSCGSCHTIPGVRGANGLVGPPLTSFGRRTFVAGQLPNTADNLVRWIKDPPAVVAGTAMPPLGVSEAQARDIAAYLYSLR